MFNSFEDQFPIIKEQILDLSLDEVKANYDLLEYDVKPFLRKANSKPSRWNPNRELSDDEEVSRLEEDVYSRSVRPDSTAHQIPDLVVSGRSRNHFEGNVGRIYAYNLLFEVTDDDLHKLFGIFGPLWRAAINYDRDGRSLGTAFIVFRNRVDAQTAFQQLDGQPLDGRKLMLRLLDVVGIRVDDRSVLKKNRGSMRPIDDVNVFEDRETLTKEDLTDIGLDEYIQRRKRAKTWNYY